MIAKKNKMAVVAKLKRKEDSNQEWLGKMREERTAAIGSAIGSLACYNNLASSFVKCGTNDGKNSLMVGRSLVG